MKTIKSNLFFALIFFVSPSFSQTLTDVARSKELTWLGIDFTQAKFAGFGSSITVNGLRDSFMGAWSYANVKAEDRLMLKQQFGKKALHIENELANKRNGSIDFEKAITIQTHEFSFDKVKEYVSEYPAKGTGYGLLFMVEIFDKSTEIVSVWVIFINRPNGQVISARRYRGLAKGIGMQNHWLQGMQNVIRHAGKDLKNYK